MVQGLIVSHNLLALMLTSHTRALRPQGLHSNLTNPIMTSSEVGFNVFQPLSFGLNLTLCTVNFQGEQNESSRRGSPPGSPESGADSDDMTSHQKKRNVIDSDDDDDDDVAPKKKRRTVSKHSDDDDDIIDDEDVSEG